MPDTFAFTLGITPPQEHREPEEARWFDRPDTLLMGMRFRSSVDEPQPAASATSDANRRDQSVHSEPPPHSPLSKEYYHHIEKHFPELCKETLEAVREKIKTGGPIELNHREAAVVSASGYPDMLVQLKAALHTLDSEENRNDETASKPHGINLKKGILTALDPVVAALARYEEFMIGTPYRSFVKFTLSGVGFMAAGAMTILGGALLGGGAQHGVQSFGALLYCAGAVPFIFGPSSILLTWREKWDFSSALRRELERDPVALEELKTWLKEKNY